MLRELATLTSRPLPPEELYRASLDVLRQACGNVRVQEAGDPRPEGALAVDFPEYDARPQQLVVLCDGHSPPIDREALEVAALQIAGALRAARGRDEETAHNLPQQRFRRRDADYYVELAAAAYRDYGKTDMRRWQDALSSEYENLRIVLERGLQDPELLQAGATLAGYLRPFWEHRGLTIEGESWCNRYLEAAPESLPAFIHARLWYALSRLALLRLDFQTGITAGEQMLRLYRMISDETSISRALNQLGEAKMLTGNWREAEQHYEESLAIQRTLDNELGRASALANLANISLHFRMDYERAEEQLTAARVAFRSLGHQSNEAWAVGTLGEVALRRGQAQHALALSDDSLAIFRRLGRHPNMAAELERRARILIALERYGEAEQDLREACSLFSDTGNGDGLAESLVTFADLRHKAGRNEEAARLLGTSSALRERYRAQFRGHTESDFRAVETPLRAALSDRYAHLFAEGERAAGQPLRFDA